MGTTRQRLGQLLSYSTSICPLGGQDFFVCVCGGYRLKLELRLPTRGQRSLSHLCAHLTQAWHMLGRSSGGWAGPHPTVEQQPRLSHGPQRAHSQGAPDCLGDEPTTIVTLRGQWTSGMVFAREKSGNWWGTIFLGRWGSQQLE